MAIKFETIKAGDVLWDNHRERAGNTTMRQWGNWQVTIIEINHAEGWAKASWNGNPPQRWHRRQLERLRRTKGKETRL